MSIWSSISPSIVTTIADADGEMQFVDVATATSWNDHIRLTVSDNLSGGTVELTFDQANRLIGMLREATRRIQDAKKPKRKRKYTSRGATRIARQIDRGEREQDPDILCPHNSGGVWCQWVAGHYGGCVLGRAYPQPEVYHDM